MLLGFTIQSAISNMKDHITDDVRYDYQYILKFPPEEAPTGAEMGFIRSLDADFPLTGGSLEVTVLGLEEGNPYFGAVLPDALNEIAISDSAQQKFGWKIGDKIILTDEVENKDYAFTVKTVTPYAAGLYVFLGIENMRTLFGERDVYYNALFSAESLDLESGRIHSVSMKEDIQSIADIFMDMLRSLIVILLGASILLFMLVMFLLMKMAIDKSSIPISLMKVFGYSEREVRKLYLGSNVYIIMLTTAISIPLGKWIVDRLFPVLVSNVELGFDLSIPLQSYALILGIIFASYFGVDALLRNRLRHILPALVLKERE
jgi:putative ABC transport system permease protein